MRASFQVNHLKCGGCANSLKKALKESFGEVEVDLTQEPRVITLELEESQLPLLRQKLKNIGYPMRDEKLTTFESFQTTAKSFVSCAVGKMGS
jgi:copper chaperone